MDKFAYVFQRDLDKRVVILEEQAADNLMFKPSNWSAKDIRYMGRLPKSQLEAIYVDFGKNYQPTYVRNIGEINESKEINKRNEENKALNDIILAKVNDLKDRGEPRDYSVVDERGNVQTNQKVLGAIKG